MTGSRPADREARRPGRTRTRSGRLRFRHVWPAYAIVVTVGAFCVLTGGAWLIDHLVMQNPVDDTAGVIALATLLRVLTIVVALASIRAWGRRVPQRLLGMALWGCAAAQLSYPLATTAIKVAILAGLLPTSPSGAGNTSAEGWANLGAAWAVFGVPGVCFVFAAISHAARRQQGGIWTPVVGGLGGIAALGVLGAIVGQ